MIFNLVVSGGGSGGGDLPWQTFVGNPLEFDAPKAHTLQSVTVGFEPIQDTSGGDPSPSNICPITGWAGCNVTRTGINVWDEVWELGAIDGNTGLPIQTDGAIRSKNFIPVVPLETYYFLIGTSGVYTNPFFYDAGQNYIGRLGDYVANRTFVVPSNARYMKFGLLASYGTTYNHDISINYPSTDHDYHAYQGSNTVTVDWQTEAGTVYGGTIDVATGLLTVEKTSQTITGNDLNLAQNIQPEGNMWRLALATSRPHPTSAYSDALCNSYKVVRSYSAVNNTNNSVALNNSAMEQILVRNDSLTTRQEIIDGLNASPIQLVYELATPLTYNLTAQQVQAIVGLNVMWTDCVSLTVQARGTNV